MKLLENLYCYIWQGRGNNANTYVFADVLDGDRPHVLIDPGHVVNEFKERCLEQLLLDMGRDGIKAEDVGLIINTHAHWDHFQATSTLVRMSGEKPGVPGKTLAAFHEKERDYYQSVLDYATARAREEMIFEPDFYLVEGDLNLGREKGIALKVIHTPGHSPGSLSLYWPDERVIITGDLLFYGGVGRTDFGGNGRELKQSIERLAELDIEYVLPGHSTELGSIIRGRDKVQKNFAMVKMNYFSML